MRAPRRSTHRSLPSAVASFVAWLPLGLPLLVGCRGESLYHPRTVAYQEDVGPVTFAVTSVTKWDDVVESELQPTFEITEARALEMVAPDTMFVDEQRLRAMALRAGIAIGQPTETAERTTET